MSLYQCESCGCIENTALGWYWYTEHEDPKYKDKKLCSACGPDNTWHGKFERTYHPIGTMETNEMGNIREKK